MFEKTDHPLREIFALLQYSSKNIVQPTSFINPINITYIKKYSEYFIIDEERSHTRKLYVTLSAKGELLWEFFKL